MDSSKRRNGGSMDVKLWGELQHYIDLKEIFAKLPLREFFQMRLVCKEWNRWATDRTFLEESFKDPIPKPYFILTAYSVGRQKLTCLLTLESNHWSVTRLPSFLDRHCGDLVGEGLLHSYHHLRDHKERVFNLHTRVLHTLPEPLEWTGRVPPSLPPFPLRALAVDATTFQLILSESRKNPPQMYDSKTNAWTLSKSSKDSPQVFDPKTRSKSSTHSVVSTRYDTHITGYHPEEDAWVQVAPPPGRCETNRRSLGAWNGRLFDVTADQDSITVWERKEHKWKACEKIPKDLFAWLTYAGDREAEIRTCFCSEYVLVYSALPEEGLVERLLMCNLVTRKWEKIEVGRRLVHLPHRVERRARPLKLMRTYPLPEFDESLLMSGY